MALKFEAEDWPPGISISMSPLRRVIRRSSVICNGWHRTIKHPLGYLPGESQNELLFLMFAELDPGVTAIAAQPTKMIAATQDGRLFSHIPDYAVTRDGLGILVEAKPDDKAARPETIYRLRCAEESARFCGYDYILALRNEMLADRRMAWCQAVWRYFRPDYDNVLQLQVATILSKGRMAIADLLAELSKVSNGATSFEQVLSLIANGHVFFDYDMPVDLGAMIRFPDQQAIPNTLLPTRRPSDPIGLEMAA